jgi:hypothetical protein
MHELPAVAVRLQDAPWGAHLHPGHTPKLQGPGLRLIICSSLARLYSDGLMQPNLLVTLSTANNDSNHLAETLH